MNDLLRQRMAEIGKTRRIKNKNEPFFTTKFDIIDYNFDFSLLNYIQLNDICFELYEQLFKDIITVDINESVTDSAYVCLAKGRKIVRRNRFKYNGKFIFSILHTLIEYFNKTQINIIEPDDDLEFEIRLHYISGILNDVNDRFNAIRPTLFKTLKGTLMNRKLWVLAKYKVFTGNNLEDYLEFFNKLETVNDITNFTKTGLKMLELVRGLTEMNTIPLPYFEN